MTLNNHQEETGLLNAASSLRKDPDNHNYSFIPPSAGHFPLSREIPERLLQDGSSTICPCYTEQDVSTRRQSPQGSIGSLEEDPSLQQDPAWQEQPTFLRHKGIQDQSKYASKSTSALFQGWNHAVAGQDIQKSMPKTRSWIEKLGTFSIIVLIAGLILLCIAVGILSFLWFGGPHIPAWKEITAKDWLSKTISICIGVIQQVMMLQLGIVAATS